MGDRWHRPAHGWIAVVAGGLLTACTSSTEAPSTASATTDLATPTSVPVATSTTEPVIASTTVVASSVAQTPPPTLTSPTEAPPTTTGPLEFVDGTFVGIRQGSLLTDAVTALGVEPMTVSEAELAGPVYACTGTADPWVIRSGGLTLVFERWTPSDDYVLTNWRYIGGPVAGFTEMVGPGDIRIGDTRGKVEEAFPDFTDLGDELMVSSPVQRFGLVDNIVDWFGPIDCVFEFAPTD